MGLQSKSGWPRGWPTRKQRARQGGFSTRPDGLETRPTQLVDPGLTSYYSNSFFLVQQMRPIGFVSPDAALVAAAVPPVEDDAAAEQASLVVPAPGAVVGRRRLGLAPVKGAAADGVADVAAGVGRLGPGGDVERVAGPLMAGDILGD